MKRLQKSAASIKEEYSIRKVPLYLILIGLPLGLFVLSLTLGRYQIGPIDVLKVMLSPIFPSIAEGIPDIAIQLILRVRLPRILAALLIGASYGATGTAFQAIFKNPLVDSNILGVTSGAGFGAALALLFFGDQWLVQVSAFVFGLLAVFLSFFGSRLYRSSPLLILTLMGILVGSFFGSLTSLLKYAADPLDSLPAITFWLLGSLNGITWQNLLPLIILTILGLIYLWVLRWRLNILSLGDAEASALGVDPTRMKLGIILFSTLMTAVAVSASGVIGWVGLVIPHAGRLIVGPEHKRLLPVSISLGAAFLMIIDDLARTLLPGEIPLGVLTGLIGVPILVLLMRRSRTGW
ncbi:MAG: iron ABC transporter permease [Brevefilum sp.]|nr:iron ABC transporter permease [Brevefilum sp.]MDW7755053.1 iron ABC transporter permease [Brevefilum sp.]